MFGPWTCLNLNHLNSTCFAMIHFTTKPYVYWTVHHLDSWIERDQLDVTCFIISLFTAQHVSDVNTSILRNLRLIWWVISWVVLFWFDVCWCYVMVWLGYHTTTETCWVVNNEIINQVSSSWSLFIQLQPNILKCNPVMKRDPTVCLYIYIYIYIYI